MDKGRWLSKQSGSLDGQDLGDGRRGVMPNRLQIKMFAYLKMFGIIKV